MLTVTIILKGLLMGLGAAVPFGPVNAEIARRTLRLGPRSGIALGCGAVTIDVIFASAAALGLAPFMDNAAFTRGLALVGGIVLIWLAFLSFRSGFRAWRATEAMSDNTPPPRLARREIGASYVAGFAMTGSNPYTWLFWFTAVPGLSAGMAQNPWHDLPMICLGVFVATLGWVFFFVGVLSYLRRFAGRTWYIATDVIGGLVLLGFGFWALWRSLERPL